MARALPAGFAASPKASAGSRTSATQSSRKLARLRRLAWLMDGAFRLPGSKFRFGLNSLIGLPPVAGDALLGAISLYIVYEGYRLGVPRAEIAKMIANVAVETAIGTVPIAGDLFDVAFKANLRNLAIIDQHVSASLPRR